LVINPDTVKAPVIRGRKKSTCKIFSTFSNITFWTLLNFFLLIDSWFYLLNYFFQIVIIFPLI
jgi:hypothetical protein